MSITMDETTSGWIKLGLVGTATFLLAKYLLHPKPLKKLPPGPRGLPYFGNALAICGKQFHRTVTEFGKEYGDLYSLRLGHYDAVVLNSAEVLKDFLVENGELTSFRPNLFTYKLFGLDKAGIIGSEGLPWKILRRTALSSLRDFGLGKKSLEQCIQEEAESIIAVVEAVGDKPIDLKGHFINASTNTICSIIFGCRYAYDSPEFMKIMSCLHSLSTDGGFNNMLPLFLPEFMLFAPFMLPKIMRSIRSIKYMENIVTSQIKEHRSSFDPNHIRDFIDIYIQNELDGKDDGIHTEKNMFRTILDLFLAGSETTSTSLYWAILFMIRHQDVQDKCREEIIRVVGISRLPEYKDHMDMSYVEATLQEVQRTAVVAPIGGLHSNAEEIRYKGYIIPKRTIIFPNIFAAHQDQRYWHDPDQFDPSRWFDEHGDMMKSTSYLPFGLGPRECPGKSLANQEIFVIFTTLLQRFVFLPADPDNLPSTEGMLGLVMHPTDYSVKIKRA